MKWEASSAAPTPRFSTGNAASKKEEFFALFLDKSVPYRRDKGVRMWLKENKDCTRVVWFPTGCPEFNPVEECRRQIKDFVVACTIHLGFTEMKRALTKYLKISKKGKLNIEKYLCR